MPTENVRNAILSCIVASSAAISIAVLNSSAHSLYQRGFLRRTRRTTAHFTSSERRLRRIRLPLRTCNPPRYPPKLLRPHGRSMRGRRSRICSRSRVNLPKSEIEEGFLAQKACDGKECLAPRTPFSSALLLSKLGQGRWNEGGARDAVALADRLGRRSLRGKPQEPARCRRYKRLEWKERIYVETQEHRLKPMLLEDVCAGGRICVVRLRVLGRLGNSDYFFDGGRPIGKSVGSAGISLAIWSS